MKFPEYPFEAASDSPRMPVSAVIVHSEAANILAGLERQKEELGPIADELIGLLRHLGVDKLPRPPLPTINPSSE